MKRLTRQHEAILKALAENNRPLSVDEILSYASKEIPLINLSTVYRNIKTLIQEAKIAVVEVPGEKPRYEMVGKGHHHHFLCNKCDKIYPIIGCPKGLHELVPHGFSLLGHSITLNGFCQECR